MGDWIRRLVGSVERGATPDRPAIRPSRPQAWWTDLGFEDGPPRSLSAAERRYRELAARAHPDRGGSVDAMQRLNLARAQARRALAH